MFTFKQNKQSRHENQPGNFPPRTNLYSFDWTKAFPACEKILSHSPLALRSEISRKLGGGGGKSKNKYRAGETEKKFRAPEKFEKKIRAESFQ